MPPLDGLANAIHRLNVVKKDDVEPHKKIAKVSVGYIHRTGVDYRCKECLLFIPDSERCFIHGVGAVIKPNGYCAYWVKGQPFPGLTPKGSVSKLESGYGEDPNGTTCQKCEYFSSEKNDCQVVDKDSSGDDPGEISPMACCGNQSPKDKETS